jgi:hypothetical protein
MLRPSLVLAGLALVDTGFVAITVELFDKDGAFAGPASFPAIDENRRPGNKGNESLAVSHRTAEARHRRRYGCFGARGARPLVIPWRTSGAPYESGQP